MRILLCSHWFFPSYGGVETVSRILAEEFVKAGASVTVVTKTPGANIDAPYQVVRRPSFDAVRKLGNQSDVIFQSLDLVARHLVPLSLTRKPVVIAHHSWMRRPDGNQRSGNLHQATRRPRLSQRVHQPRRRRCLARPIHPQSATHSTTRNSAASAIYPRTKDIVFMGRLVSDKGVDLLLQCPSRPSRRKATHRLSPSSATAPRGRCWRA